MSEFDRRDDAARGRTDDESISKLAVRLAKKISDGSLVPPELASFSKQKQDQPLPVLFGTRDFVEPPIAFVGDGAFFTQKRSAASRPVFQIDRPGFSPTGVEYGGDLIKSSTRFSLGIPKIDESFIHHYYTMLFVLCHGTIDYVPTIRVNDKLCFVNPFVDYNDFKVDLNKFRDVRLGGGARNFGAGMGVSQIFYFLAERLFKSPSPNTLDGVGGDVIINPGLDNDHGSLYLERLIREAYAQGTYSGIDTSVTAFLNPIYNSVATLMFPKIWWGLGSNAKKVTARAQRIYTKEGGRGLTWYPEKAGIKITSDITEEITTYSPGFNDIHSLERPTLFLALADGRPFGYASLYHDNDMLSNKPLKLSLRSRLREQMAAFWEGVNIQLGVYLLENSRGLRPAPAMYKAIMYKSGGLIDSTGASFVNTYDLSRPLNFSRVPTRWLPNFSGDGGVAFKISQECSKFAQSYAVSSWWGSRLPSQLKDRMRCVIYWLPSTRLEGNLQYDIFGGFAGSNLDSPYKGINVREVSSILSKWNIYTRLASGTTVLDLALYDGRFPSRVHGAFGRAIKANQIMVNGQTAGTPTESQYTKLGTSNDPRLTDMFSYKIYQNNDIFILDVAELYDKPETTAMMRLLGELVVKETRSFYRSTSKTDNNKMFTPGDIPSLPSVKKKSKINYYNMNPAHAIRDVKTSRRYGQGVPDYEIDEYSFREAADTYHREQMGISIIWDKQSTPDDFIKLINKHTNSVTFTDHTSGKYKLFPIRKGDNLNAPTLTPSNVVNVENFRQPTFDDLVTSLRVSYWEIGSRQTVSFTVHDEAALRAQNNKFKLSKIKYSAFIDQTTVVRAAYRDLRALSRPLISCDLKVFYFSAVGFHIGKFFLLTWPDYGLLHLPMRVTKINFGDARVNFVTISAVQDGFEDQPPTVFVSDTEETTGEAEPTFVVTPPTIDLAPTDPFVPPEPPPPTPDVAPPTGFPERPSMFPPIEVPGRPLAPTPPYHYSIEEAPYYRLAEVRGRSVVDSDLALNGYDMYLQAMTADPGPGGFGLNLVQPVGVDLYSRVRDGVTRSWKIERDLGWVGAISVNGVGFLDTQLRSTPNPIPAGIPVINRFAFLGARPFEGISYAWEIIYIEAISADRRTLTVKRSVLDSMPAPINGPASLIIWPASFVASENKHYGIPTFGIPTLGGPQPHQISTKLRTYTAGGTLILPLQRSLTINVPRTARALRPYPPGFVKINDEFYPSKVYGRINVTWQHRNRKLLKVTGFFEDDEQFPEGDTNYRVAVRTYKDTLFGYASSHGASIHSNILSPFTISVDWIKARLEGGVPPDRLRIDIYALRDQLSSYSVFRHFFDWSEVVPVELRTFCFESAYTPPTSTTVEPLAPSALQFCFSDRYQPQSTGIDRAPTDPTIPEVPTEAVTFCFTNGYEVPTPSSPEPLAPADTFRFCFTLGYEPARTAIPTTPELVPVVRFCFSSGYNPPVVPTTDVCEAPRCYDTHVGVCRLPTGAERRNPSTGYCELIPTERRFFFCLSEGYSPPTVPVGPPPILHAHEFCFSSGYQSCDGGRTWNQATQSCECPVGYYYDIATQACVAIPVQNCRNADGDIVPIPQGNYRDSHGNCALIPLTKCWDGTTLRDVAQNEQRSSTGLCEVLPACPTGQYRNAMKQCVPVPTDQCIDPDTNLPISTPSDMCRDPITAMCRLPIPRVEERSSAGVCSLLPACPAGQHRSMMPPYVCEDIAEDHTAISFVPGHNLLAVLGFVPDVAARSVFRAYNYLNPVFNPALALSRLTEDTDRSFLIDVLNPRGLSVTADHATVVNASHVYVFGLPGGLLARTIALRPTKLNGRGVSVDGNELAVVVPGFITRFDFDTGLYRSGSDIVLAPRNTDPRGLVKRNGIFYVLDRHEVFAYNAAGHYDPAATVAIQFGNAGLTADGSYLYTLEDATVYRYPFIGSQREDLFFETPENTHKVGVPLFFNPLRNYDTLPDDELFFEESP